MTGWIAILVAFFFLAVPYPECVTVVPGDPTASLPPHAVNRSVDFTVNFHGQPARGASLSLSTGNGQFLRQVPADSQGLVHFRGLAPGKYLVRASEGPYDQRLLLVVAPDAKTVATGLSIELFSRSAQDFAWINAIPVTEHLPRFAGTVKDPSPYGAPVPGASIEIYPDGATETGQVVIIRADDSGHFATDLLTGVYRALIREQGFKVYRVGFQIEKKAAAKDLYPVLQIANGC